MTDAKKKPKRPDWTGTYRVLRDGAEVATVTVKRSWFAGGPRYIVSLGDGRYVTSGDPAYALHQALQLVAPGESIWPWYPGCSSKGYRLRAEGKAPWEPQAQDEDAPPCHKTVAPERADGDAAGRDGPRRERATGRQPGAFARVSHG